jgi:hypothetical protein
MPAAAVLNHYSPSLQRLYLADQNGAKVERGHQNGVGGLRGL